MVRSIQPGRLASALSVCDCPKETTGPLFQFWSTHRVKNSLLILFFTVLLLQAVHVLPCDLES